MSNLEGFEVYEPPKSKRGRPRGRRKQEDPRLLRAIGRLEILGECRGEIITVGMAEMIKKTANELKEILGG